MKKSFPNLDEVNIREEFYDTYEDENAKEKKPVYKIIFLNHKCNICVEVITYGATITNVWIPNKNGHVEDVVLGFNNLEGYLNPLNPYCGATIGRVTNRIANATIKINENTYKLSQNMKEHTLHGGFKGFDKVLWNHTIIDQKVYMTYLSKDGEEGFPGDLLVTTIFQLTEKGEFIIEYKAMTTKTTYVNLTNHSYFNLGGENQGAEELYQHKVNINADFITEVDDDSIPTGKLIPVGGTIFDLRTPTLLEDVINKLPKSLGLDQNFCITGTETERLSFIARVFHPNSGRVLEVFSNQPGVQFYTANYFPENPKICNCSKLISNALNGKTTPYYKHSGFSLETQNFPDAANRSEFPNSILKPGDIYHHIIKYKFLCFE